MILSCVSVLDQGVWTDLIESLAKQPRTLQLAQTSVLSSYLARLSLTTPAPGGMSRLVGTCHGSTSTGCHGRTKPSSTPQTCGGAACLGTDAAGAEGRELAVGTLWETHVGPLPCRGGGPLHVLYAVLVREGVRQRRSARARRRSRRGARTPRWLDAELSRRDAALRTG